VSHSMSFSMEWLYCNYFRAVIGFLRNVTVVVIRTGSVSLNCSDLIASTTESSLRDTIKDNISGFKIFV